MRGHSSFPRYWRRPQPPTPAAAAAAQVILLHGIPAQVFRRSPRQVLLRASAVRFPALSHRLPPLLDRLLAVVEVVRRAAVVVAEVEADGKLRRRYQQCFKSYR